MSAVACLRVSIDGESTGLPPEILSRLVEKYTTIYLDARWVKPRTFQPLEAYAYLLTDPGVAEFDPEELRKLSVQLQAKLFGASDTGTVALLLFEGTEEAARAFAGLNAVDLSRALTDPRLLPPGGRLSRIESSPDASSGDPPPAAPASEGLIRAASGFPGASAALGALEEVQGLYFIPRELFIGDILSSTPARSHRQMSILNGADRMPSDALAFDTACVLAALRYLVEGATATLFLPIAFSNVVRSSERETYSNLLSVLPLANRKQLSAIVYDTPRDPTFTAVSQIRTTLAENFANIHLQTNDPGFEVEKLQEQAVACVTLALPQSDERDRLSVLRRFAVRAHLYRRKQIWCGVTDLRTALEFEACVAAKIALVSGAAISGLGSSPVGGRRLPALLLPYRPGGPVQAANDARSERRVS